MRLVMFSPKESDLERGWPGRVDGDHVVQLAAQTLQVFFTAGGALRDHAQYALADIDLRAPVLHPPSIRLFGGDDEFVFGNTAAVFGPDQDVPYPEGSSDLRSRPALAAVVGADGVIGGFTGANAWFAPDLPSAKSYDFALSVGPVLVTPDELDPGPGWDARLSSAARNTVVRPGDLLVVAVGGDAPAARGELVEVSVDGIGTLRNRVS
jgi:2-keto-4-pentenoate hydratase/2-oxohepta-3-ene-1,7-dioic acid hydratase in catechol pathway